MMNNYAPSTSSSSSSEDEEVIYLKRPKIYRIRQECLTKYDDLEFFQRFRLTKPTVLALLQRISHLIVLPTNRGGSIQPMDQLLLTLRFYATGSVLLTAADFIGVSKTSASRIVAKVSRVIVSLRPQYIKMNDNEVDMERLAQKFYGTARFPLVIGALDCTLIKIESPRGDDAEIFRCRKRFFAINVQTVSNAELKIIDIVARSPGSSHDQTIFNNSRLKRDFESGKFGRYLLIADSGYSLQPYIMTKLPVAHTPAENLFNESLIRTRNVVERQYGVWKRRFPVLSLGMRVKLSTIMAIIVATAVLHNIAIDMRDIFPEEWLENMENEEIPEHLAQNVGNENTGHLVRNAIINDHFQNMI